VAAPMNDQQILAFLDTGAPTAHLATVRSDGRPHVVPIWFVVDGKDLVFVTHSSSVKARNLRRTQYAAVSVDDPQPPFSFALVEGPVTLISDMEQVRHWGKLGAARYIGAEAAHAYAYGEHFPDDLLGRLTPARMTGTAALAE
jgi:PPOX class probable F420-dependent enzyme